MTVNRKHGYNMIRKTSIIYFEGMSSSVSWHTDKNHKNKTSGYPLMCLRFDNSYYRFKARNDTGKTSAVYF
jgi:hypothetical protein